MRFLAFAFATAVAVGCSPASPPTTTPVLPPGPPSAPGTSSAPAGSAKALADAVDSPPSPNPDDNRITSEIRQKIDAVPMLSGNARTVQIITAGGKVSLRGTVDSSEEKDTVEKLAAEVVGIDNLTSDLVWKDKE